MKRVVLFCVFSVALSGCGRSSSQELLNVSYDPTREFYHQYNDLFKIHWKEKTGQDIAIQQSHGGSGKQARSVLDGLPADVVSLALSSDIDVLASGGLIAADWQKRLPQNSAPFYSTIVFVVRKGNPRHIQNWDDLIRKDVAVITPNPRTSGGARWNYLAILGYAMGRFGDESRALDFLRGVYANVPVLDTGARGATNTFAQRRVGDVLIAWENEAFLALKETGSDSLEIIVPPVSILAEPPVAVVDAVAKRRGTEEVATEYLRFLYSSDAQALAARHYYRPRNREIALQFKTQFPEVRLFTIEERFGSWQAVQKKHFGSGGVFDQIYSAQEKP